MVEKHSENHIVIDGVKCIKPVGLIVGIDVHVATTFDKINPCSYNYNMTIARVTNL